MTIVQATGRVFGGGLRQFIAWAKRQVGGRARAILLAAFASVLALDSADVAATGAMSRQIEASLHVGKAAVGLLLSASLLLGALSTLPFGRVVDRSNRTRLLSRVVVAWGVAMFLAACATGYWFLFGARLLLAGVTAAATPALASLVGDWFPTSERARMYGYILAGELVGTGFGFLVAGELANWSWRAGYLALGLPAFAVAWWFRRLPEPKRGGDSRLERGRDELSADGGGDVDASSDGGERKVQRLARQQGREPRDKLVLDVDPREKSLWWAAVYVLRIPSNLVLIIASTLGYYFLSGLRTFGVQYLHEWFHLSHALATALILVLGVGGLVGVLVGGRVADALVERGKLRGRVMVAAALYLATTGLLVPALLFRSIWLALGFFTLAGLALAGVNPPLDAARLDIMPSGLWGRAESVRTAVRRLGEAFAPLAFGWMAGRVFDHSNAAHANGEGLHLTFLVMLVPLLAGGLVALIGLRTYPRDVATAEQNERRAREGSTRPSL